MMERVILIGFRSDANFAIHTAPSAPSLHARISPNLLPSPLLSPSPISSSRHLPALLPSPLSLSSLSPLRYFLISPLCHPLFPFPSQPPLYPSLAPFPPQPLIYLSFPPLPSNTPPSYLQSINHYFFHNSQHCMFFEGRREGQLFYLLLLIAFLGPELPV